MKKLLLVLLFFGGCVIGEVNKPIDAGISTPIYTENQFKWYYGKYYPICVQHCEINIGRSECENRCYKDFQQIKIVLIRAIKDGKEDDFQQMMETWYGE